MLFIIRGLFVGGAFVQGLISGAFVQDPTVLRSNTTAIVITHICVVFSRKKYSASLPNFYLDSL
jgi:hypothetical protein